MKLGMLPWRQLWVLGAVALLAACGGGGGGEQSTQVPPLVAEAASVRIENVRVQLEPTGGPISQYRADIFETSQERGKSFSVTVDLGGNTPVLNGKTVYVNLIDPDQLFSPSPLFSLSGTLKDNRLTFEPLAWDQRPGHYKGNLSVSLCLDLACNAPLGNGPIRIPYDIQVRSSYRLEGGDAITLRSEYGVLGTELSYRFSLPVGAARPQVDTLFADALLYSRVQPVLLSQHIDGSGFNLRSQIVRPGTYRGFVSIFGAAEIDGRGSFIQRHVPLTLEVAAPADGVARWQAQRSAMSGRYRTDTAWGPGGAITSVTFRGEVDGFADWLPLDQRRYVVSRVEYLDSAGQAISPICQWLGTAIDQPETTAQHFGPVRLIFGTAACANSTNSYAMQPGRYTAQVVMKAEGGAEAPERLTVTLDVLTN